MYELKCPKCKGDEIVLEEEGIRQIIIDGVDEYGAVIKGDVTEEFLSEGVSGFRCVICDEWADSTDSFIKKIGEEEEPTDVDKGEFLPGCNHWSVCKCKVDDPITVLEKRLSVIQLELIDIEDGHRELDCRKRTLSDELRYLDIDMKAQLRVLKNSPLSLLL